MPCQLPADCLSEIFECLEEDKITLHSCSLVNRLWCEIAVRILWRNVWSFQYSVNYKPYRTHVPLSIISTLVACLPNESKDLLCKNEIFIETPTWKPPLFNYGSFCKVLSIHGIDAMIQYILEKQQSNTSRSLTYQKYLLSQEILRMFMNQISSLKSLDYDSGYSKKVENIMFTYFIGAKDSLMELKELNCSSDIYSEFFYQISQLCHNIRSITIEFENFVSNGLADLISLQNNLKHLTLIYFEDGTEIITSSIAKFSLTLTKLKIKESYIPLSFISRFTNLQELILSFDFKDGFDDFNLLQSVAFSQLKILKFLYAFPNVEMLIRFLEINGKNLKELYIGDNDNSLNIAIARLCPNLEILFTIFMDNELETLKVILNSCQYLESINVWCGDKYLNEKNFLEVLAKHSSKNFHELKIFSNYTKSELLPEELESFFVNWGDRIPQKSLSFIIVKFEFDDENAYIGKESMKVIDKYMKLGYIKKFGTRKYDEEED